MELAEKDLGSLGEQWRQQERCGQQGAQRPAGCVPSFAETQIELVTAEYAIDLVRREDHALKGSSRFHPGHSWMIHKAFKADKVCQRF